MLKSKTDFVSIDRQGCKYLELPWINEFDVQEKVRRQRPDSRGMRRALAVSTVSILSVYVCFSDTLVCTTFTRPFFDKETYGCFEIEKYAITMHRPTVKGQFWMLAQITRPGTNDVVVVDDGSFAVLARGDTCSIKCCCSATQVPGVVCSNSACGARRRVSISDVHAHTHTYIIIYVRK